MLNYFSEIKTLGKGINKIKKRYYKKYKKINTQF